jgi:hypothetical protein
MATGIDDNLIRAMEGVIDWYVSPKDRAVGVGRSALYQNKLHGLGSIRWSVIEFVADSICRLHWAEKEKSVAIR